MGHKLFGFFYEYYPRTFEESSQSAEAFPLSDVLADIRADLMLAPTSLFP
jgi:hypothetical protein